jgi:hypothetical protein
MLGKTIAVTAACAIGLFSLVACSSSTTPSNKTDVSKTSPEAGAKKGTKGTASKGPTASKTSGQKSGGSVTSNKSKAEDKGAEYEGATCDEALEGTAWCGDETTAIFCLDGHWYALDCAEVGGDICAETTDLHVVECLAPEEVE